MIYLLGMNCGNDSIRAFSGIHLLLYVYFGKRVLRLDTVCLEILAQVLFWLDWRSAIVLLNLNSWNMKDG